MGAAVAEYVAPQLRSRVVAVSLAAYLLAYALKGDKLITNQVDVVDVGA